MATSNPLNTVNVTTIQVTEPGVSATILGVDTGKVRRFTFPIPNGLNRNEVVALVDASKQESAAFTNQKITALDSKLVPIGGEIGQVVVRTSFGPAWATLNGGTVTIPTTPPAPAPSPSPTDYDYSLSFSAANASTLNMRTKTAQLA